MVSVEEALRLISQNVSALSIETVALEKAVGRVLAAEILADRDSPPWRKSMMDGFAVRSSDINSGTKNLTIVETVMAGGAPKKVVESGQATRIMTGAPVPEGADAIVMIEHCQFEEGSDRVVIEAESVATGKHLMEAAANFARRERIFAAGRKVRAVDVGLLAEVGAVELSVFKQPTVAVLPTGDELVSPDETPRGPQIRNSNGPMLIAMLGEMDIAATDLGIGHDNREAMQSKLKQGLEHDLLLLSGGVSAGTLDLVPSLLKELGVKEVFHKVKVKPGKPIFFGVHDRKNGSRGYVFGLPGNPVSSLVGFRLFVTVALSILTGKSNAIETSPQLAKISCDHETRGDRPTWWPARRLPSPDSHMIVQPLVWNGSSDLLALGKAEGLIEFPAQGKIHKAGSEFPFWEL
ncbi:molybdopterin molybdotransferase MoeA [Mariniblastus fucicola]|uniref:Molybdopterin molybdenumtransferase n=1 Tax=Mariniblastus fucicola TaxID=980251 RepID=A0A5B9P489_9BACT|nr:molybdopterin molybdotransferase MoeA [Mariniblastus fucicola]QEG21218.1 Molybdopterin molybdenumtransferase [Mariniblastus fucicola]